jgi:hypothetical protein
MQKTNWGYDSYKGFFFWNFLKTIFCQKSKGSGLSSPAIFRKLAPASHQAVAGFFNILLS